MYKTDHRLFLVFPKLYEFEFNVTARNFPYEILSWTFTTNKRDFQ